MHVFPRRRLVTWTGCVGAARRHRRARRGPSMPASIVSGVRTDRPAGARRSTMATRCLPIRGPRDRAAVRRLGRSGRAPFAEQLGVEVDLRVVDSAGKSVGAVKSGAGRHRLSSRSNPMRSDGIRFTAAYVPDRGRVPGPARFTAHRQRAGRSRRPARDGRPRQRLRPCT